MFWLGLIIGIAVGTIFHAVFSKWGAKAKNVGQELANDIKTEAGKVKL
jgi:hypothetical protein